MNPIKRDNLPAHLLRESDAQLAKKRARRQAKQDAPSPSTPGKATPRMICNASGGRNYAHPELAPYTGRPGALDHLLLPSRVGSTLHYRNLSSIQTVRSERM